MVVKAKPHGKSEKSKVKAKKEAPAMKKQKRQRGTVKRAIKRVEPKLLENPKTAMFIRGSTANQRTLDVLKNFAKLKKPFYKMLMKKNTIRPFDDVNSLEFLARKNDCSLFLAASDSKKRPNNLILGRFFNYQLLDMIEFGVSNFASIESLKSIKSQVGQKPMFIFQGDLFQYHPPHVLAKNMIMDFFRGEEVETINLSGLSHVICVTALGDDTTENPMLLFRTYAVLFKRVAGNTPRVDLQLMGPSLDLQIRRSHENTSDLKKQALRIPKMLKTKKVKNVEHNVFGEKIGRVHMTKQEVDKMQVRKIKALKVLRKEKKQKPSQREEKK